MATLRLPRLPQLPAALQTLRCDPATLYRVSGHATDEPYFGRANTYRFDDPHPQVAARFGTFSLASAAPGPEPAQNMQPCCTAASTAHRLYNVGYHRIFPWRKRRDQANRIHSPLARPL